jgi:hypothetical protein
MPLVAEPFLWADNTTFYHTVLCVVAESPNLEKRNAFANSLDLEGHFTVDSCFVIPFSTGKALELRPAIPLNL